MAILPSCSRLDKLDKERMTHYFNSPGYSSATVLRKEESWTGTTTRYKQTIVYFRVTIDGYPDSIKCEGELIYTWENSIHPGHPSFSHGVKWYTKEGKEQSVLVDIARTALMEPIPPQYTFHISDTEILVLKRWIEMGKIKLGDITYPDVRIKVKNKINGS
jgi:hypothetical protein